MIAKANHEKQMEILELKNDKKTYDEKDIRTGRQTEWNRRWLLPVCGLKRRDIRRIELFGGTEQEKVKKICGLVFGECNRRN